MKKIIFGLAIVSMAVLSAKADYLYWQVSESQFQTAFQNADPSVDSSAWYSTLYMTTDGGTTFTALAGDWGTNENSFTFASADASTYSGNNVTYYVELASYDTSETNYKAYQNSGPYTYAQLHTTSLSNIASMKATWSGVTYRSGAVPEPTSGLMMLVGMALLGLKRRRV